MMEDLHGAIATVGTGGGGAGVYVGCMYSDYVDVVVAAASWLAPSAVTGSGASFMVGRLSYTFGMTGPCVSTDTACSSSLVATHLAHSGLSLGETSLAVAAGSNVMLHCGTTNAICQLQALSPVGRCRTFDAAADGYGRGEGIAVAVLAPRGWVTAAPGAAVQHPYAVVRASATNQGGRSGGLTAPNGPAQSALIRSFPPRLPPSACHAHASLLCPNQYTGFMRIPRGMAQWTFHVTGLMRLKSGRI